MPGRFDAFLALDRADDRADRVAGVRAVEAGSVEARDRAVEEQGVGTAELIAKEASELAEAHRSVRDGEHRGVCVSHPDAVADLPRDSVFRNFGVELAVDDEHWAGLSCD